LRLQAEQMIRELPAGAIDTVDVLRINPGQSNQGDTVLGLAGPERGSGGQWQNAIDLYPGAHWLRNNPNAPPDVLARYVRQTLIHEAAHTYFIRRFGDFGVDGSMAQARAQADGLFRAYAGTNNGEYAAEAMRWYVESNGGQSRFYDPLYPNQDGTQGKWVEPAEVNQRFGDTMRTLDSYFQQHPAEMTVLQRDFRRAMWHAVLVTGGAAAVGAAAKLAPEILDELTDDDRTQVQEWLHQHPEPAPGEMPTVTP
jgi:hypothetical protein